MIINRDTFFEKINPLLFHGNPSPPQKEGINAILDEWEKRDLTDPRWLAYMLATTYHETAETMQPIEEFSKGHKRPYGQKLKMDGKESYDTPDKIYYGRGFVQLTWYDNYENLGRHLNLPLLEEPEQALTIPVAAKVLFEGMIRGTFTSKPLSRYFNDTTGDWVNARKIINGLDKADLIAGYAHKFAEALGVPLADAPAQPAAAGAATVASAPAAETAATPTMTEPARAGNVGKTMKVITPSGAIFHETPDGEIIEISLSPGHKGLPTGTEVIVEKENESGSWSFVLVPSIDKRGWVFSKLLG